MPRCLVAIDFGTGAVRSVVFDTRGKQLGAAYREISYDTPSEYPGACEFDGAQMWRLIGRVVRKSLAEAGVRDRDVLAVATTSQRHGMALIGKRGETLYAGPNRDSRGRSVAGNEPVDEIYRLNGHWPMPIIVPYRLRWFERHHPEVLERAAAMVMPNDWVTYQLCGEAHVSDSSGIESELMDLAKGEWSRRLIEIFGVDKRLLPPILKGGEIAGKVTAKAAAMTGLREGTPVAVGGGDTNCALLACGATRPGEIAIVAGTTAPIMVVLDKPDVDMASRTWTGIHVAHGRWVRESNAGQAGMLLRWFRDTFSDYRGANAYDRLFEPAKVIPPGAEGLMAVMGAASKDPSVPWSSNRAFLFAPGRPVMFEGHVGRPHFARAMLESVAYAIKGHYDQLPEARDGRGKPLAVCGGCTQGALFNDILSNVLERPLVKPRAPEVAALGAAMCAAVGAGVYATLDEAAKAMTRLDEAATPDKATSARYQELYGKWRDLHEDVRQWG